MSSSSSRQRCVHTKLRNSIENKTDYDFFSYFFQGTWANDIDHVLVPGGDTVYSIVASSIKPATSYHFRLVLHTIG